MAENNSKKYKKRVIQPDSEDEEQDQEPVKRAKVGSSNATTSTTASTAPPQQRVREPIIPPSSAPDSEAAAPSAPVKAKLDIFTTGGSDDEDEDEDMDKEEAGVNGKKKTKEEEQEEKEELAASKKKQKQQKKDAKKPASKKEEKKAAPVVVKKEGASNGNSTKNGKKESTPMKDEESSEDDKPLASIAATNKKPTSDTSTSKNAKASTSTKKSSSKAAPKSESDLSDAPSSSSDDSDAPLSSKKKAASKKAQPKPKAKAAPAAKEKKPKKETPAVRKIKKDASASPSASPSPAKKGAAAKGKGKPKGEDDSEAGGDDEEAGEEAYRWWDDQGDDGVKWTTLVHSGVIFPPDYEPHGVKMKYAGAPVRLAPEAEEVASFFAAILETDYPKNPTFVKNFFSSFREVLKAHPCPDGTKITSFDECDFTPIFEYLEAEKQKKKTMTTAEKKVLKEERLKIEEPYSTCLLDGRVEKVGNFRVEPPGLFRGRGEHPKTGLLKTRVQPEQISINIGKDAAVPAPPAGHRWKSVVHDNTVTWLATWKENINGAVKYVFLAAGSSLKGQSDFKKFEKARALKDHIDRIRRDYTEHLKDREMMVRQRATAVYLIDRFALRNGNEKGDDEADTVGCCSLRFEHVTLTPPSTVTFDFLGKDSIRYTNEVKVDEQVFKNLKMFKKAPKTFGDLLFDRVNTGMVNKYLTNYMDGLTAKVFRTYNASWTFVEQLRDTPADASVADKVLAYNRANRMVAVLCNHQKSVSKGHSVAMDKLQDKIRDLKYQRKKLRSQLFALVKASDEKKKKKDYEEFEDDESDIDDEWIEKHEVDLVVLEREKIAKKFERDNKKLVENDEKPLDGDVLKERLLAADELEEKLAKEKKGGWKATKFTSPDKVVEAIKKMDERIAAQKMVALDRDEGKEVSLGTSKINYLDPRITFAWCKKHGVPTEKMFSKTLLEKFTWATEVEADWEF